MGGCCNYNYEMMRRGRGGETKMEERSVDVNQGSTMDTKHNCGDAGTEPHKFDRLRRHPARRDYLLTESVRAKYGGGSSPFFMRRGYYL